MSTGCTAASSTKRVPLNVERALESHEATMSELQCEQVRDRIGVATRARPNLIGDLDVVVSVVGGLPFC